MKKIDSDLHLACAVGDVDQFFTCINNGASLTTQDESGRNAVIVACEFGQAELVKILIHKVDKEYLKKIIEIKDNQGMTALSWACQKKGMEDVTKLLVENGANINHVDNNNDTPLTLAQRYERKEIVRYLNYYIKQDNTLPSKEPQETEVNTSSKSIENIELDSNQSVEIELNSAVDTLGQEKPQEVGSEQNILDQSSKVKVKFVDRLKGGEWRKITRDALMDQYKQCQKNETNFVEKAY